mmetsp:Transcript_3621/g.6300  ORF Transcript_3621/g.6300 Transcript_3621/m.6300 type:complete len:160 (-) Transcript_3621:998-1477(-)
MYGGGKLVHSPKRQGGIMGSPFAPLAQSVEIVLSNSICAGSSLPQQALGIPHHVSTSFPAKISIFDFEMLLFASVRSCGRVRLCLSMLLSLGTPLDFLVCASVRYALLYQIDIFPPSNILQPWMAFPPGCCHITATNQQRVRVRRKVVGFHEGRQIELF